MALCASDEWLGRFLDDELDAVEEAGVVEHVETCGRCQGRLLGVILEREANVPGFPARAGQVDTEEDPDAAAPTDVETRDVPATSDVAVRPGPDDEVTADYVLCTPSGPGAATDPQPNPILAADVARDFDDATLSRDGQGGTAATEVRTRLGSGNPEVPGYEILGRLGEGGMGVVYKARQRGLNRPVAIKMIIGGLQARADFLARLRVEAEAVARLRHPNIIQIYEIGEVEGLPFVSLELLEGGDLDDYLAGTPQPGRSAAELMATLGRAVQAAHEAGIVHRDLKPGNVLFAADGVPKITDFGLAKLLESDSRQTQSGQIMGTPSYMAPEQASGHTRDVGPAADVYALGAILYEALTGRPPFKGETPMDTMRQVVHDEPVPPSRLVPRVARDLETICLKCLNKEPRGRYASAEELALDLDRFREGHTIRARRTPPWERGAKWARRRPGRAIALAFGLLALLGTIAGVVAYGNWRNNRIARDQIRGVDLLARSDSARGNRVLLEKADVQLAGFLENVRGEARLEPIALRVEEKQRWVADQLRALSALEASELRRRADRASIQKFQQLRQETQLWSSGPGIVGAEDRLRRLRASAHEALAIYAKDPSAPVDAWVLADALPDALSSDEQAAVRDGCYDLLLILSPAESPAEGLRILERAAQLRRGTTAAYHLRRAECLERALDLAGAESARREAAAIKPATPLDYLLLGREQAAHRELAAAIRSLDRALELDPAQTSAHLLLAYCDINIQPKRLGEARASLTACIHSHPDIAGLYLLRALVSGEEGLQAAGPQAADSFLAAEADYRRALARSPDDGLRYALLANRGLLRMQSVRLEEAAADLDAAIRIEPGHYQAHNTLGQVRLRQGRLDEAALSFGRAIACRPEPQVLAVLHRNRALIHAPDRNITPEVRARALRDLDEAIRRGSDSALKASDQVWRARLLFGGGQFENALAACDAALALVPGDPAAHRVRISALMELKRYDDVLAAADAYLLRGEPTAEILEMRGLAHQSRRDYAAAIADFTRALDLRPGPAPAGRIRMLNRRGWAYQYADAPRLALADFDESLRLAPDRAEALGGRGLALVRLGDWRRAVADAEGLIRQTRAGAGGSSPLATRAELAQALFNAARIFALAGEQAMRDVARRGEPRPVDLCRRYRARALDLLDDALERVDDPDRREEILDDPALSRLRRGSGRRVEMRRTSAAAVPARRGELHKPEARASGFSAVPSRRDELSKPEARASGFSAVPSRRDLLPQLPNDFDDVALPGR